MQAIKVGRDYTGYAVLTHSRCGVTTRIATPRTGNCFDLDIADITAMGGAVKDGARLTSNTRERYHADDVRIPCRGCGARLLFPAFQPVYGRYVAEMVCNSKCTGAIGPSCDCSCGGRNHGGKHG